MSRRVNSKLAKKYKDIEEGVVSVMGGQVLDYEAKRILKKGEAIGEARGEARISLLFSLLFKAGRNADAVRAAEDKEFQANLLAELLPAS